jgi:hypothetical protein
MRKKWQAALGIGILAAALLAFGQPTAAWSADPNAPAEVADNLSPDSPLSHPSQGTVPVDTDHYHSEFHNSFQNLMPDAPPPGYTTMLGKWTTMLYGFVQFDTVYDTTNSFNNWPFNGAPANSAVVTGGSGTALGSTVDSPRWGFDVNNSRIGFALSSPVYNGYKIRALLEMDFLANPAEGLDTTGNGYITNPIFRIRHFFFDVTTPSWGNVLVGQYWSLFGAQPYNIQNNLQIAPGVGTAYGRFPQIRWYKIFHMNNGMMLEPAVAAMLPPTTTGAMPAFAELLKFADSHLMSELMIGDTGKGQFPAMLSISGIEQNYSGYTNASTALSNTANTGFNSWTAAGAVDLILPIIPVKDGKPGNNLTLQAEYTWGQGDAWQFPNLSWGLGGGSVTTPGTGFSGQGVIYGNVFEPLDIQTYNADLQYYFPDDAHTSMVVGFAVDNASNLQQIADAVGGANLGGGGSTNSLYTYLQPDTHLTFAYVDLWHDFTPAVRAGIEYGQYDAVYTNGVNTLDNRFMMSWFYFF